MSEIRLAKIMADRGLCSRREAEKWIGAGIVRVDGVVVDQQGAKFLPDVTIEVDRSSMNQPGAGLTIMINKPEGLVSHLPEPGQREARELLEPRQLQGAMDEAAMHYVQQNKTQLAVAGRLDRASRGLLLMTFNGLVVKALTATKCHEKEYIVTVEKRIESTHVYALNAMRDLSGEEIQPMQVKKISYNKLNMVLIEGKNHQIRRACRKAGLNVMDLSRVRIGPLVLGNLREGCWRPLDAGEVLAIINTTGEQELHP